MERVAGLSDRIHLDFMDEDFTGTKSINLEQAWWDESKTVDLHVMFSKPQLHLATIVSMQPNLVVIHAEAECNFEEFSRELSRHNIKTGLALLQGTSVESVKHLLPFFSHVLIFSGDLGHHGGTADLDLLAKISEIRALAPDIEISWDGGITDKNALALNAGGVDVLNVGGFIQSSESPKSSYDLLVNLLKS